MPDSCVHGLLLEMSERNEVLSIPHEALKQKLWVTDSSSSLLAASLSEALCLSAFMPASRIADQSLPWGMGINPSPRAVGIPPTPESSSQAFKRLFSWAWDQ